MGFFCQSHYTDAAGSEFLSLPGQSPVDGNGGYTDEIMTPG